MEHSVSMHVHAEAGLEDRANVAAEVDSGEFDAEMSAADGVFVAAVEGEA